MQKNKDYDKWKNSCPITEKIQPRCMLFKTNYRNLDEAETQIKKLDKSLSSYNYK